MKQCLFMAVDIAKLHNNVIMRNSKSMLLSWKEYVEKNQKSVEEDRNSYSKTDQFSHFYAESRQTTWDNDQLLPAYNVQVGVADEYNCCC